MAENLEESLTKDRILEMFYEMKGDLGKINAAIDAKMAHTRTRKISVFEGFIKARMSVNPRILKMAKMEITPAETAYLSQYPDLEQVEVLDLRQNHLGDEGLEALANSPVLLKVKTLDLRNNKISRRGLEILAQSKTWGNLEKVDLRLNQLGKRWETKLKENENFPNLKEVHTL